MSSDPEVERCLSAIRALSNALSRDVAGLSADEWDRVTNCAPWRVREGSQPSHLIRRPSACAGCR